MKLSIPLRAVREIYLACISPISPLYLAYISPTSPQALLGFETSFKHLDGHTVTR